MTEDEAIKLLLEGLKLGEDDKISSIASEIVQRLGCLPLAIAQASAYIEAENILPSEFLDRYEDSMREVLECIPPLWEYTVAETPAGDTKSAEVIAKTAFSTWNLSHRLLRPETPTGSWKSSVLSLLAKFHNHDISEEFFRSYFQTMSRPPSTRPEWTTLFEDDRAQWSSRKFGRLMREFSRLSLITRIDLVTGEAQLTVVSLHPLVRDWINLRQDNATSLENFKIFTCILGSHLSPFLHRKHRFETPFLAPRATYQCYGHICTWAAEFLKFRAILQPTALIASGEDPIPVCAELPLAIALFQQRDFDNACLVYRWLWDTCDVEVYQMRAIKMIAGTSISLSLLFTNLLQDSRDEARAQFDYWNKVQGASDVCDTILLTSLMEFAKALTDHGHSRVDAAKCKKLCEEKLAVLPRDDSLLVPRHTLMSCLARAAATLGNRTLATSLCRTMVQETAVLGGNGFRKHCWSDPQWAIVLEWLLPSDGICDCDVELVDEISTGGMEMHTEARRKGFSGNSGLVAYRSRFLVLTGRHEEAKAFVSVEAANLKEGWHTPSELRLLYRRLGNALECQSASDKAYEAFSEALRYTDPSPANGIRLGLLQDCGRTAMEFNPELAEAHFALRLSTLKQIGDFDEIAACYVELSRVRSQMGRRVGFQSCRDLLIRALEIWGLQVCVHGLQRECEYPGHIETTLVLNEQEPTQVSPAKEVVSDCLAKRKSCWYGYQVLAELASTLALTGFYTESITAFQIAKDVFESNKDTCAFKDIRYFIGDAVAYIRDSWDGIEDDERISGTITWAEVLLAERRGHEPSEDPDSWYGADDSWWEDEKRSLLELLEPEADSEASSSSSGAHSASERDELPAEEAIGEERVKRANPFRTLAARLSSTLSDGASGKSSTSSRWSIGRGLRPSASVAAAPAKPKVS
ncbi:hypothetical protein F4780DRAFT_755638 [Xylariomycetidae sp. FL0641]|nr:hypothetical protein F4780DRAFT_755638 [Xylariomycetidae sp. FL0641]